MHLKEKLDQRQTVGGFWLSLGSIPLAEFALDAGAESVVFDLQHGLWERNSLECAIGIVKKDVIPLVRVASCNRYNISSALDAGAEGVIVPLIDNTTQARQAVEWAHYPPSGSRSGGGIRPLKDFQGYVQEADKTTVVALMIETRSGFDNVSEIAQTSGVDMLFIGTGDLSLSLGISITSPEMDVALQQIKQACDEAKICCGIFTSTLEDARKRRDQGFHFVILGDDISANRDHYKMKLAEF